MAIPPIPLLPPIPVTFDKAEWQESVDTPGRKHLFVQYVNLSGDYRIAFVLPDWIDSTICEAIGLDPTIDHPWEEIVTKWLDWSFDGHPLTVGKRPHKLGVKQISEIEPGIPKHPAEPKTPFQRDRHRQELSAEMIEGRT